MKFQKDDLFNTQKQVNLLYYSLNTRHPLFKEIKSIVSKTAGVEGGIRKALLSVGKVRTAFIYGSFAARHEKKTSDIDLMIIGNPEPSDLNEKIRELEKRLKREINPTVYSVNDYRARKKAGSGFISDLMKRPKIMLIGGENDL